MVSTLVTKFGRRIVVWAVVAIASAAARKAMEAWATRGSDPAPGAASAA